MSLPGAPHRPEVQDEAEATQDGGNSEDEDGTEDDASMSGNDGEVLGDAPPAGTGARESLESFPGSTSGDEDALRTMWTRAEPMRPLQLDGGPGPGGCSYSAGSVPAASAPASASSSDTTVAVQPEAGGSGTQRQPAATPNAATARRGRRASTARRGPKRCKRCGRFLPKESWIRSITRSVSKTLTTAPWGRSRNCRGCDRPMRGFRRGARGRSRSRSRARSRSRSRRAARRKSRSRSRSRSSRRTRSGSRRRKSSRSGKKRRRRRSIDDQKFFVC